MLLALALVSTLWQYTGALRPADEHEEKDGGLAIIPDSANSSGLLAEEHHDSKERSAAAQSLILLATARDQASATEERSATQLVSRTTKTSQSVKEPELHGDTLSKLQDLQGLSPQHGESQHVESQHVEATKERPKDTQATPQETHKQPPQLHSGNGEPERGVIDNPVASKVPMSPIDILLGVRADHPPFPDDGDTEVFSELDHAIFDVQEILKVFFRMYDRMTRFVHSLVSRNWWVAAVVYASAMFLMLGLYSLFFKYRDVDVDQDFHFGLLDCMGDVRICIYGVVCAPIRWADTMQKAGLVPFLHAFFAMWLLLTIRIVLFHFFTWGCLAWFNVSIIGAFFRQKIRKRCALEEATPQSYIEDFCAWCCCAEFAVCQEARQVEAMLQQESF